MRGAKKELRGAVAIAMLAAGVASPAQSKTLDQNKLEFYTDAVMAVANDNLPKNYMAGQYKFDAALAYTKGLVAALDEYGLDSDDKKAVFDEIGEDDPKLAKLLRHVDGQLTDNTSQDNREVGPGDDEPNSIDSNPFNYLSKLTPEEWAKNTIKVMKGQRGRAASESHLDSMEDFKSNMIKAGTPEAFKFYREAIELLKVSGINFTG